MQASQSSEIFTNFFLKKLFRLAKSVNSKLIHVPIILGRTVQPSRLPSRSPARVYGSQLVILCQIRNGLFALMSESSHCPISTSRSKTGSGYAWLLKVKMCFCVLLLTIKLNPEVAHQFSPKQCKCKCVVFSGHMRARCYLSLTGARSNLSTLKSNINLCFNFTLPHKKNYM